MAASDMPQCVVYDLRGKDFLSTYKFQFEKVIDVGMCGEILLVSLLQNPDAKRVVKKFNLLDESRREKNIAAFYKEAKYLQYFDHPFLMKCYVAGTCAEYMAIGMTFYRRGTLDRYIGSICLQQSEVIVTQVACALRYMHNKNVAHIDVKLDNIFLSKNFDAILGDFGLAVELSEAQKTLAKGKCGGTPGYLAPELIAATPDSTELDPFKVSSELFLFYKTIFFFLFFFSAPLFFQHLDHQ